MTGPYRSCARAAREAGYSESVARKPQIIFESAVVRRVWCEWEEIYFPLDGRNEGTASLVIYTAFARRPLAATGVAPD
jgi:hypothetical protein